MSGSVAELGAPTAPGLGRVVRAEMLRARRTFRARLWSVGLLVCLVQTAGWLLMATQELRQWDQLIAWQSAYATALAAPLTVLVAASTVRCERFARGGGTDWRPVHPGSVRLGRFLVTAVQLLAFELAVTLPMLPAGMLLGLSQPPVLRLAATGMMLWWVALPALAGGLWLAERVGLLATTAVGVAWQVVGTVFAESASWWAIPPTWSVRPLLPLLHVHANGVAATPDEPVRQLAQWPVLCLSALLTAVLLGALFCSRPPGSSGRRGAGRVAATGRASMSSGSNITPASFVAEAAGQCDRRSPARAAYTSMRGLRLGWLAVVLLLVEVGIRVVYGPDRVRGAFGLALLPAWVALVACLVMPVQLAAARAILTRGTSLRWCVALGGVLVVGLAPVVLGSALLTGYSALPVGVVAAFFGTALLLVDLWLATALGAGAVLGVNLVAMVVSIIFSSPQLVATGLWVAGPWAWAYSADTWGRAATVVVICVPVALAALAAWSAALRRRACS